MLAGILDLDRDTGLPLPEQIYRKIRAAVGERRLAADAPLPSSRELARQLGVSRNTVNAAYELLAAEGIIAVRPGARPRVAELGAIDGEQRELQANTRAPRISRRGEGLCRDVRNDAYADPLRRQGRLQPGAPAEDCFPRDDWARALRRAARHVSGGALLYEDYAGYPPLRRSLAEYLTRERGVRAKPEQILVLPTAQGCLHLLAQVLSEPGDCAWLEDPGYLGARAAFASAGLNIEPLPVDHDGADASGVESLEPPKLIYVTPSHQYPFGYRMSLERRLQLIDRAREAGALILEDDYDSEFLFSGRPIAALQGLGSGDEVIYLGTFAKSMLPGLRIAYMVVPESLAEKIAIAQRNSGLLGNVHTQAALADFIESGHYRAHLKRIRETYEARGRMLVERFREGLGNKISVDFPVGGIQLVARLPPDVDDRAVVKQMVSKGFMLAALSGYGLKARLNGLVIGFADASEADIDAGVMALAQAIGTG